MKTIPDITLSNGIGMPAIGLGTHTLHGKKLESIIKTAIDNGIRLIDTAWMYGNEKEIGRIIKDSNIPRDNLFLVSKVTGAQIYGRKRYFHLFKQNVIEAYEDSCRRLKTDYLDLFLLHSWQFKDNEYEQLLKLYESDRVRSIGVTQASAKRLEELNEKFGILPHVNQIHVQPLLTKKATLKYSRDNGVQSLVISACKGNNPKLFENPILINLARQYNVSIRQIVYRWLFQLHLGILTRTSNPDHLAENIDIFDFELSNKEMNDISSLNCNISFVPYEAEGVF